MTENRYSPFKPLAERLCDWCGQPATLYGELYKGEGIHFYCEDCAAKRLDEST